MQQLYQHRQQGRNKAQALRLAQLGFISRTGKTPSYPEYFRHPYYWAAFILMGNWLLSIKDYQRDWCSDAQTTAIRGT